MSDFDERWAWTNTQPAPPAGQQPQPRLEHPLADTVAVPASDLEQRCTVAATELATILDLDRGLADVLQALDRVEAITTVGDILQLSRGAAAALAAAGVQSDQIEPGESDDAALPSRLEACLKQIVRINRIIDDLGKVLATDRVYAPSLADVQSGLDELAEWLADGRASREEDFSPFVAAAIQRIRGDVASEIEGSGYGPRLNGVENELRRLLRRIGHLFYQSNAADSHTGPPLGPRSTRRIRKRGHL